MAQSRGFLSAGDTAVAELFPFLFSALNTGGTSIGAYEVAIASWMGVSSGSGLATLGASMPAATFARRSLRLSKADLQDEFVVTKYSLAMSK